MAIANEYSPPLEKQVNEAKSLLLDTFPRILTRIELTWGSLECSRYIKQLIIMERERETRRGFPPEIMSGLLTISIYHDEKFKINDYDKLDPFINASYK